MKSIKFILFISALLAMPLLHAQNNFISDNDVTDRMETEMRWQPDIPADRIDVRTEEGILMLEGTVSTLLAKDRTEMLAGNIRGVRGVVNQIKVEPGAFSNEDLKKRIEKSLFKDPASDSYEVNVYVNDGNVRLTGQVQSWQEKQLVEYTVKGVRGIRSLENNIEMEPTPFRADNEIKAEITAAMENDVRLYLAPVDVQVKNGVVKLIGSVGSLNERRLAMNYAWTYGVKEIDDSGLDVDPWLENENLRAKEYPILNDKKIKKAVEDAYLYDPRVASTKPEVTVSSGVVTLRGSVATLEAKRAAEQDARNIVGVTLVKNHLKTRPAAMPNDADILQKVKAALVNDTEIDLLEIDVKVYNGIVYLSGNVNTYYQRARAEEVVARVTGVVRIVNQIDTIYASNHTPHPYENLSSYYYPNPNSYSNEYNGWPSTDAQILRNIKEEWWWDAQVNESTVNAEVDYGVATLTGAVDSWEEMNAAVQNAFEGGAKSVINNIELAGPEAN